MEKERPNYYAILPANVRYNEKLNSSEKIFYSEITALTQKTGECWASNNYFARLYKVSTSSISSWVKKLKNENLIDVIYIKKGNEIEKRIIKILGSQNTDHVVKILEGGIQNTGGGYSEYLKENNTSINNTSNNNTRDIVEQVIDYLNLKTNKSYKSTTNKTKDLIKARINEGFTLDDFKKVIDIKTSEWLEDTKMNKFLRPETLFSNKFEGYLNQKDVLTTKDIIKKIDYKSFFDGR